MDTFVELISHFLTKEEFDKIDFNFNVSVTSLNDNISEEDICLRCRKYIYEETKDYATNQTEVFGMSDQTPPTQTSLEIFRTLATLYVGGGSIIELRHPKEGYLRENKHFEQVERGMKEVFAHTGEETSEKLIVNNKVIKKYKPERDVPHPVCHISLRLVFFFALWYLR